MLCRAARAVPLLGGRDWWYEIGQILGPHFNAFLRFESFGGKEQTPYFDHNTNQKGLHNADNFALYTMYAFRLVRNEGDLEEEIDAPTSQVNAKKLSHARNRHQRALQPIELEQELKDHQVSKLVQEANVLEEEEVNPCELNFNCEGCLLTPGCDFESTCSAPLFTLIFSSLSLLDFVVFYFQPCMTS